MRPQTQLFPNPLPEPLPEPLSNPSLKPQAEPARNPLPPANLQAGPAAHGVASDSRTAPAVKPAPIWLQRLSLFVLVLFCVYLGALVMVLPWWSRMWDQNLLIESHPAMARLLHLGAIRGLISGLGMLDIWIGISEAVNYRESNR